MCHRYLLSGYRPVLLYSVLISSCNIFILPKVFLKRFFKWILTDTEELSPNPYILIGVIYNPRFYNYGKWTQGIFNYKGYNFYVDTIEYGILLHKTGRSTTISCIAPQKYQFEFHHRGNKDLYWWYEYRDGQIFNRK